MAAYMTYWPGEQLRALKRAGDTGPIRVVLGSIHTKMPSIDSVQVGDVTSQQPRCKQRGIKLATLQSSGVCDPRGIRQMPVQARHLAHCSRESSVYGQTERCSCSIVNGKILHI